MTDINLGTNPNNVAPVAVAILALMDRINAIESSWDADRKEYTADLKVAPFYNCRERGYVVWDRTSHLAIIFCEHRNTDNIVISTFTHKGINPPTFDEFIATCPDADKWSMWQQSFRYNQPYEAADWIMQQFEEQYS